MKSDIGKKRQRLEKVLLKKVKSYPNVQKCAKAFQFVILGKQIKNTHMPERNGFIINVCRF